MCTLICLVPQYKIFLVYKSHWPLPTDDINLPLTLFFHRDCLYGGTRDDYTNAMIEFGKKLLLVSVNVIKDFIKMMISLTTGLITVLGSYFPIWSKTSL